MPEGAGVEMLVRRGWQIASRADGDVSLEKWTDDFDFEAWRLRMDRDANELVMDLTEDVDFFWSLLRSTEAGRKRAIDLLDKSPKVYSEWKMEGSGTVRYRNGGLLRDAIVWRINDRWHTTTNKDTFDDASAAQAFVDEKLLAEGCVLR